MYICIYMYIYIYICINVVYIYDMYICIYEAGLSAQKSIG